MACEPTCTRPTTGTSVPTYQNQPTGRYGQRLPAHTTATVAVRSAAAAQVTCHAGIDAGYG